MNSYMNSYIKLFLLPEDLLLRIMNNLEWYYLFNKYRLISSEINKIIICHYQNKLKYKLYYRSNLYFNLQIYDSDKCDVFPNDEIMFFENARKYYLPK